MNLGNLQARTSPAIGGVDVAVNRAAPGPLNAISGNQLIGLDVWAGVGAAGRMFGAADGHFASTSGDIEQSVSHILAPLG